MQVACAWNGTDRRQFYSCVKPRQAGALQKSREMERKKEFHVPLPLVGAGEVNFLTVCSGAAPPEGCGCKARPSALLYL